ncbi:MAG TPA: response regulator [Burkholderiales bacterium]|nr:response regulator [Burkholderiales bacterium]
MAIVEDDAEVRVALMRLLSSAGFATQTFASGEDFVRSIDQDDPPACVVLDLHMPGLNGFEVQQTILVRCPGLRVVVITGHDTPDARSRALSLGARAYLAKPVDGDALLVAIRGALQP